MDRSTIYDQASARDYDFLWAERLGLISLSQAVMDLLGTTSTVVSGFAATPDAPADLSVNLAAGDIYQIADIDASAWGSLASDTAQVMQQGIAAAQKVTLSTAGLSSGQSRYALIQAQFTQADVIPSDDPNAGVLPYLNATNPSGPPWSGPNNSGSAQATRRTGGVTVQVVYGNVATTGSEVPPNPTAGWVPLYLIDLAFGQTQITAPEILVAGPSVGTGVPSNYTQAPFLVGLLGPNPAATTSHHGGIAGQAPKVNLASEVQGTLGASNLPQARLAHGECVLNYVSATQIALVPKNGCNLIINGAQQQIPSAGVTGANTGVYVNGTSGQNLAASTRYLVGLALISGTLTLGFFAASTYSHLADTTAGNIGTEVISQSGTPQSAWTLVGQVQTNGSSQFVKTATANLVRSWFNREGFAMFSNGSSINFSSTTRAEISASMEVEFLVWSDEAFSIESDGYTSNSGAGNTNSVQVSLDGTLAGSLSSGYSAAANAAIPFASSFNGSAAGAGEGLHTASLFGMVSAGTGSLQQGYLRVILVGANG